MQQRVQASAAGANITKRPENKKKGKASQCLQVCSVLVGL